MWAGGRPDCACSVCQSQCIYRPVCLVWRDCGNLLRWCENLNVNTVSDSTVALVVWVWRSALWSHPGFRLLCPCVFVGFLPGNFLPPPSAFFVSLKPLLPLPSVPDCFASQSSGVLVSSCCWPLSIDLLDSIDFWLEAWFPQCHQRLDGHFLQKRTGTKFQVSPAHPGRVESRWIMLRSLPALPTVTPKRFSPSCVFSSTSAARLLMRTYY